jgi:DNA-binding GntR family transcriptional regulator
VEGVLKPGERLVEERLAHHLGVSRTPIREALAMLEVEGLVKSTPKKGTTVRTFTREEIKDLYDLRVVLESYAARQAAQFITAKELDQMGKLYEEMEACLRSDWRSNEDHVDKVRYLTSKNNQFHQVVMKASRNSRLEAILTQIVELPLIFRAFFWYTKEQLSQSNHHHYEIIQALETQDAERAERVMAVHIGVARDLLLQEAETQLEWPSVAE